VTPPASSIWGRLESLPCETVLAEGPLRRVVRYAAQPRANDETDGAAIIAKYYRDGAEGSRTAHIMQSLHAALERSTASSILRVPRVLGYDAKRQLLLQEQVPGVRFDTVLSGASALKSLELAGRAIAALRGLDVPLGPARHMAGHIRDLIRPHPRRLARALPELTPRLHRILDALSEADARWRPRRPIVPVHRDVHPKQLFLDGPQVCLIDWDLSTLGDAAVDVGNLIAYLRARRNMDDSAVEALLRGYEASGATDALERAPQYEALTYVRLSCKRYRLRKPAWREECHALIARAERCLALVR
jgi:aminoglycoside phosphotransferase (APT) family kinase protein